MPYLQSITANDLADFGAYPLLFAAAIGILIWYRKSVRYLGPVVLIALCYPAGELIQQLEIGPQWLQWHLSDFGVTAFYAMSLYAIPHQLITVGPWQRYKHVRFVLFGSLTMAWLLILSGFEIISNKPISWWPAWIIRDINPADPIDTVMYIAGTALTLLTLWSWRASLLPRQTSRQPVPLTPVHSEL